MADDKKDKKGDKKGAKHDKAPAADKQAKQPKAEKPAKAAASADRAHDADQPHQPARLKDIYRKEIAPALTAQFGYKSPMEVPRISKVVLNMGVGEATADKKILDNAVSDMTKISGQKPVITKARKAIAGFKIREGYPIGCMVTLRHDRMYEFLDRLITVALPRVRDFRGVSGKGFDGQGNYIQYVNVDASGGYTFGLRYFSAADFQVSRRAASTLVAMSAIMNWMAWCIAIGTPNCTRSLE